MEEDLLAIQAHLTDRDHTLLGWLADHGVLTTFQIAYALYPSLDFAQRRLKRLWNEKRLLGRFRPFRAEGGTYPYHWLLSQLGTDVVVRPCPATRAMVPRHHDHRLKAPAPRAPAAPAERRQDACDAVPPDNPYANTPGHPQAGGTLPMARGLTDPATEEEIQALAAEAALPTPDQAVRLARLLRLGRNRGDRAA